MSRLRSFTEQMLIEAFGGMASLTGSKRKPAAPQLEPGSPCYDRLQAVMTMQPPPITDGELRCKTPDCKSAGKLSRQDRECWWCGEDDFEVVSEELKVWMRVPKPLPPQIVKPTEAPANVFGGMSWVTYPALSPTGRMPAAQPMGPALSYIIDELRELKSQLYSMEHRLPGGNRGLVPSNPGWGTLAKARNKAEADARRAYDEEMERKQQIYELYRGGTQWGESP